MTRTILWMLAAVVPVAALTAGAVAWPWTIPLLYVSVAFVLQWLVRLKNADLERTIHVLVLSGSAPFATHPLLRPDLVAADTVHIASVLLISIGVGYLMAERLRPSVFSEQK